MKKALFLVFALVTSFVVAGQNSDSLTLVTAPRETLSLPKGVEGYTIARVNILNSAQTISVIKYSPKRLKTVIVQPEKLTKVAVTAAESGADFAVNAGYWDVRIDQPSTFIILDGKQISVTADFEKERVDGLVCIGKKRVVIDYCNNVIQAIVVGKKHCLPNGALVTFSVAENSIYLCGIMLLFQGVSHTNAYRQAVT